MGSAPSSTRSSPQHVASPVVPPPHPSAPPPQSPTFSMGMAYPHEQQQHHLQQQLALQQQQQQQQQQQVVSHQQYGEPHQEGQQQWNTGEWDDKRDMVFARVLSADEFLGRMEETDEKVRSLSTTDDRQQHVKRITELLGLRGHLQDELLRIEAMLAEDDPDLTCLRQFEQCYPKAVLTLRELKVKREAIKMSTPDTSADATGVTLIDSSSPTRSSSIGTDAQNSTTSSIGVGTSGASGQSTGTQSSPRGPDGGVEMLQVIEECIEEEDEEKVDDALKIKHDEEENYVSQKFAERLSHPREQQLSQDDVDRVLNDHLLSMQALRNKQNLEKQRIQERMELKKRERLLGRRAQKQEYEDEELRQRALEAKQSSRPGKSQDTGLREYKVGSCTLVTTDQKNAKGKAKPVGAATIIQRDKGQETWLDGTDPSGQRSMDLDSDEEFSHLVTSLKHREDTYSDDFEDDDDSEAKEELRTTLQGDLWETLGQGRKSIGKVDLMGHLAAYEEEQKRSRSLKKSNKSSGADTQTDGRDTADSCVGTDELLQDMSEMDEDFVQKLLRENRNISDEDFAELLRRHLADVEDLRKQRQSEKERLNAKLKARLRRKQNRGLDSGSDEDVRADERRVETAELDEEADNEISRLEEDFQADLVGRRRYMTDDELQEMFERHRRQREALIKKYASDRQSVESKMNTKLAARLKNKKSSGLSKTSSKKKLLSDVDDQFFQDLQRMKQNDDLTEDSFAEILNSFLDQRERNKKERKGGNREQDEEASRTMASDIMQQHQHNSRQIHDMRRRQKDLADERMKAKLRAKKKQKENVWE